MPAKAAKLYSLNQERLDETLEYTFKRVLELGSDTLIEKLANSFNERLAKAETVKIDAVAETSPFVCPLLS